VDVLMSAADNGRQDDLEWQRQAVFLFKIAGAVGIVALFFINHFEISGNTYWIVPAYAIAAQLADRWVERIPETPLDNAGAIRPDQIYDLCFVVGAPRIRLRLSTRGVRLVEDAIAYTWEGLASEKKLLDIEVIRLQLGGVIGEHYGLCAITFKDGTVLRIHGCNSKGYPQYEQSILYRDFVLDLHHRLIKRGAGSVVFVADAALALRQKLAIAMIITLLVPFSFCC
jgi:hypothetical protein